MWETVELRELRIFLTLADGLHFARTADRLHLSQSRVSQAIQTLETRLGGQLFERTSRRVALTPLGRQMQSEVAPAFEQLRQAYEHAREQARGVAGTLRIGLYTPMSAGPHMIDIVACFTGRNPTCEVVFVNTRRLPPRPAQGAGGCTAVSAHESRTVCADCCFAATAASKQHSSRALARRRTSSGCAASRTAPVPQERQRSAWRPR